MRIAINGFGRIGRAFLRCVLHSKKMPKGLEDIAIIPGVNEQAFNPEKHIIVSLGSCTTNAFMTTIKVLDDAFGIVRGFMTTTHAYTNTQVLLDVDAKDLRFSRAAALNIIPAS